MTLRAAIWHPVHSRRAALAWAKVGGVGGRKGGAARLDSSHALATGVKESAVTSGWHTPASMCAEWSSALEKSSPHHLQVNRVAIGVPGPLSLFRSPSESDEVLMTRRLGFLARCAGAGRCGSCGDAAPCLAILADGTDVASAGASAGSVACGGTSALVGQGHRPVSCRLPCVLSR